MNTFYSFYSREAIPVAPPPWTLKAKAWTFLYSDPDQASTPSHQSRNNTPEILQGALPPGSYHPFEDVHIEALQKVVGGKTQYCGGWLKSVMIVRYEESNVGPYDELILIPGRAVNPHTGEAKMRISTVFVSTDASVWNGRRNWNIPKHRADFKFIPIGKSDLILRVYHPEGSPAPLDSKVPFFTVLLKGSSLPKLPVPKIAPIPIVQPPLLPGFQVVPIAADDPESRCKGPWLLTKPSFKGTWRVVYASKLEDGDDTLNWHGDGIGFPEVKLWSVGAAFEGVVDFGVPTVISS